MARLVVLTLTLVVALAPGAHAADLAATQRALAREMARAGASSGAYVVDLGSGRELYASRADVARIPASVEKLYTAAGALLNYGPEGHLTTQLLSAALPDASGTITGDVVLRGGGDPTFGPVAAAELAAQVVENGVVRIRGRVIGDESAFDSLRGVPYSRYRLTNEVGPLSALIYNRGKTGKRRPFYQANPPRFAAEALEQALERHGVRISGNARAGVASSGMTQLSAWDSPTVASIVRQMNQPSDNFIAETLIKGLGAGFGTEGSTAAGGAVIDRTVARFAIEPTVVDGSGLSRLNRTTPRQVVRLLAGMDTSEAAEPFDASLAVAGRNGTLFDRMRGTSAQGRCRAKTGTLHDVSALAGFCDTKGGHRVAFAFLMNYVWPNSARRLQDRMTATLARYNEN